jgi:NTP pyrophosphatase (non-canonical NTP hydrolase)
MKDLQQVVADYIESWSRLDPPQFVIPDVQDAVSFMVTEAGESLDEVLRQKNYVRNNPGGGSQERLIEEVADTVFMAYVTAIAAGGDLTEALLAKLAKMDRMRRERAAEAAVE